MSPKIKILQVIPKLGYGGAETGCFDLAHYLSENNCSSFIVTSGGELIKYINRKKVKLIRLPVHSKNPILMLINSMNEMQSTGSAAGLESYLEQLDQIGQGQSEINMGTMQLGQMGMMSQQEMMKRLQAEQQALKQQLEQLIEDMPGNQGQGGLSKAAEDMEDVINSFKNNRINSETKNKQQKILSRLLDSQKSLKKRDFSDKRKGEIADNIDYQGPLELPNDLGEKDLLFDITTGFGLNKG